MPDLLWTVTGVLAGFVLVWLVLVGVLWASRPDEITLRELLSLLPDTLRLLARLAADPTMRTSVRVRLWLLLGYLALPFDLIPDVIPVIGFADDAVLVAITIRAVVRRAGLEAICRHWPGTHAGREAVLRAARVSH